MADADVRVNNWAPIAGRWSISPEAQRYEGPQPQLSRPFGICVAGKDLTDGCISACVCFSPKNAGQLLFGYQSLDERYIMAGMGGWDFAYTIGEYVPGFGWRSLAAAGSPDSLSVDQAYEISVTISGQRIRLAVDGVRVLNHILDKPLTGGQVGLFAFGEEPVEFSKVLVDGSAGAVFVVMKFSEPYAQLYEKVIRSVASEREFGLRVYKADEVFGPGIILNDIVQAIIDATIVVVEITPDRDVENVFYELGFAHGLGKQGQTILMAERGRRLPFDISQYRVVFYENTIAGKDQVEDQFRKHLRAILRK
jgi:hypothetical protein